MNYERKLNYVYKPGGNLSCSFYIDAFNFFVKLIFNQSNIIKSMTKWKSIYWDIDPKADQIRETNIDMKFFKKISFPW